MRRTAFVIALLFAGAAHAQQPAQVIGPVTPGHGAIFNSPTIIKDSGAVPGTGTVNSGTAPQIAYYATTGNAISGSPLATLGASAQGAGALGLNVYPTAAFNSNNGVSIQQGTGPGGAGGSITFWAQNGPLASPTAVVNQQELGFVQALGWNGSAFAPASNTTAMVLAATENWTPSANGSGILFQATPNGTTVAQNEISIQNGLTALAASEFTKAGLGIGTINAENGLFDTGVRVLSAGKTSTLNLNGDVSTDLSNNSAGTGAITYFQASNVSNSVLFGIGGTGYTGVVVDVQNKAFALAGVGTSGFTLGTSSSSPLDYVTNNVIVGRQYPSGGLSMAVSGTPIADPGNGNIAATKYFSGTTGGLASKSCLFSTANVATGITLTITGGLVTGTTTC